MEVENADDISSNAVKYHIISHTNTDKKPILMIVYSDCRKQEIVVQAKVVKT
jgi:hypothetical protein